MSVLPAMIPSAVLYKKHTLILILYKRQKPVQRQAFAVAFALIKARKVVRGLRQGLTEGERDAVADVVVWRPKKRDDPWKLSEELPSQRAPSVARPWMPEDGED